MLLVPARHIPDDSIAEPHPYHHTYTAPRQIRKVDTNAIIKIPLWPLTVISTFLMFIMLLIIGYLGCTDVYAKYCSSSWFPMISDVLFHKYYDRVFICAMVFHSYFVQWANIRAYY